jgi:RimJ/RimL family protein N-acetyltransferase
VTTPALQTERLILREWRDDDLAPYAALNADAMVMEHFPSTLTREQSDEMVDRMRATWAARGYGLWAAEVKETRRFIGFIGLSSPSWDAAFTPCVEVGWRLSKESWGNGYAPEGALAALEFGFTRVDLPRDEIVSFTTVANDRSRRVMEKIGLHHHPSDDFDHPLLPDGPTRRHVLYRISRSEWESRR